MTDLLNPDQIVIIVVSNGFFAVFVLVFLLSGFWLDAYVSAQESSQQDKNNMPSFEEFVPKTQESVGDDTQKGKSESSEKFSLDSKSFQFSLLLTGYLFAFPIASGIVIFYISRGIVRGIMKANDLKRKHRMIYISCGIGIAVILFTTGVLTVRTTFAV